MSNIFRCDMNGVPFSYPSLELESAEIAKICHEISTNYGKYEGKTIIMHRTKDLDRDWCIYYVENRGMAIITSSKSIMIKGGCA